jgi:hypothetical protein
VSERPRRALGEPRLVGFALAAVAVLVLCIGALFGTDDVLIVPGIALVAHGHKPRAAGSVSTGQSATR